MKKDALTPDPSPKKGEGSRGEETVGARGRVSGSGKSIYLQ